MYSQASTFWCDLNVSLFASSAQLRLDTDQLWKQFGWYRVWGWIHIGGIGILCVGFITNYIRSKASFFFTNSY